MSSKYLTPILLLAGLLLLPACTADDDSSAYGQDDRLVIEGWIEADQFPVIKLTRPVPISDRYQSVDSLGNYVERWRRISISDGRREVVLTGKADSRYFPPYIYTTSLMRGEAGHSYTLSVWNDDGSRLTATTTIPDAPPACDSFSVVQISDTLCELFAHVGIPAGERSYYRVFATDKPHDRDFLASFLGVLSSDMIGPDGRIAVHRGRSNLTKGYIPYFHPGDSVVVRLARIDSAAFVYWRRYEDMLSLSRIPLFPSTTNMPTQIPGAYGFWQGWASTYRSVVVGRREDQSTGSVRRSR